VPGFMVEKCGQVIFEEGFSMSELLQPN
jgi:hypothetical protein